MSKKNRYLIQQAAAIQSPIAYAAVTGAASIVLSTSGTRSNIQLLIDQLSWEGTDADVRRFFFDEMSPQARLVLIKTLLDLQAITIA